MTSPKQKIGYKSPPVTSRFKKGCSGNPAGRPKRKDLVLAAEIDAVLQKPGEYTEKGRRKSAPNKELLVKRLIQLAIKGNTKAADVLIDLHTQGRTQGSNGRIQVIVEGWLPTYEGQTGDQKTRECRSAAKDKAKASSQEDSSAITEAHRKEDKDSDE